MQPSHIHDFLQRFADDLHTEDEHRQFLDWFRGASVEKTEEVADRYELLLEKAASRENSRPQLAAAIERSLDEVDLRRKRTLPFYKKTWLRVAASILAVVCATGLYFALRSGPPYQRLAQKPSIVPAIDILPGGNKAILVKSDGSQVVLEDSTNQTIMEANGQKIANKKGSLSYRQSEGTDHVVFNSVKVPRKGKYQVVLADGTNVWLNAESSLTYPSAFVDAQRKVELTGEAYFEVARDPARPFHVVHKDLDVEVLGTNFNINSYEDEKTTKVTLLQGSVRVLSLPSAASATVQLKPGQQAQYHPDGRLTVSEDADLEETMAWKNGRFQFKDTDLKSIMRQLMRWYDIEVAYEGNIEDRFFTADISRSKNLSSVLKILELSNIHCTMEGKKLILRP
ncbi:FecR family protein [Flavitalea flava]